jgi:hypothetical protein
MFPDIASLGRLLRPATLVLLVHFIVLCSGSHRHDHRHPHTGSSTANGVQPPAAYSTETGSQLRVPPWCLMRPLHHGLYATNHAPASVALALHRFPCLYRPAKPSQRHTTTCVYVLDPLESPSADLDNRQSCSSTVLDSDKGCSCCDLRLSADTATPGRKSLG